MSGGECRAPFTSCTTDVFVDFREERAVIDRPYRLLLRGRLLQHRANLGCSCRTDASTPGAATTSGARGGSSTGSASSSAIAAGTAGADQIDRLLAVRIDELGIGSLVQK